MIARCLMKAEIIRCVVSRRKREDITSIHARNGWTDARSKERSCGAKTVDGEGKFVGILSVM